MRYTKKQFLADVAKEAKALKKNATKAEIARLNFNTLNYDSTSECVYGQMTSHCRSNRGIKLITACCKRFFDNYNRTLRIRDGMKSVAQIVNGEKSEQPQSYLYLSSIETYITMPWAKNKNLIAYLKGERKDLVL